MCENPLHKDIAARGQAHAMFPPSIGKSIVVEYRADGCVTWRNVK